MKFLFSFFIVFHLLIQTCYGKDIKPLHVVLINNLVDPNENQVNTLANLAAYPFVKGTNASLIMHFGLVVNYTIIFSIEPDDIITFRALDMDDYSIDYFQNLVKNHTANSCRGASLKSLQRALEITSMPSVILMATNRRPKDLTLMLPILETMIGKINPAIVFQIAEDGSMSDLPAINEEVNVDRFIPATYFKRNNIKLVPEYGAIMDVSKDLVFLLAFGGVIEEMNTMRLANMLLTLPKISTSFPISFGKRSIIFVYDVNNATEKELDEISRSMEEYYQLRNERKPNSTFFYTLQYSIIFSSRPNNVIRLDRSENYTAKDFQNMIKYQTKTAPSEKPSLHSLQKALQVTSTFSWIHYHVDNVHDHNEEILLDIIQQIKDKIINVKIYGYGNLKSKRLPVFYRTIQDASRMVSGSSYNSNHYLSAIIAYAFLATTQRIVN